MEGEVEILIKNSHKYQGEYKNENFNGYGILEYFTTGSIYTGYFKDGKEHGKGKTVFKQVGYQEGIYEKGVLRDFLKDENANDSSKVKMELVNGVYEIPAFINDVVKINFIMDTGASIVQVTPDIFYVLYRSKTITDRDFLDRGSFVTADGNVNEQTRFILKSIKIGNKIIENVEATVTLNLEAPMLLGQSVLKKLGKLLVDYNGNSFIIIK